MWCGRSTCAFDAEVEHERRAGVLLLRDLLVGPARRSASGTSFVMAWAKSALTTTRVGLVLAGVGAHADRRLRPSNSDLLTGSLEPNVARPSGAPAVAIASMTALQPPIGCQTPYSYSRNDRIVNRLGQLNGDMPRYLLWNENARRTPRVAEVALRGRRPGWPRGAGAAGRASTAGASRSLDAAERAGQHRVNASSLARLSAMNLSPDAGASCGLRAIAAARRSGSAQMFKSSSAVRRMNRDLVRAGRSAPSRLRR